MTRPVVYAGCALVLGSVLAVAASPREAQSVAAALPQSPAPAARGAAQGPPAPAPGRGRGAANPAAMLFTEHCASCHGTDLAGGRAPSLFDEQWLATISDARMTAAILNGVPNTEMESFKAILTEQQVWQLIQYARLQSGVLKTRPTFVADPSGVVLKTAKETVKLEVVADGLNTPWALAFLPDARLLVTERTVDGGTLRVIDKGVLSPPVKGNAPVAAPYPSN